MPQLLPRWVLRWAGPTLAWALSTALLLFLCYLAEMALTLTASMLVAVTALRLAFELSRRGAPLIPGAGVRLSVGQVLTGEFVLGLALATYVYLVGWEAERWVTAAFVAINPLTQALLAGAVTSWQRSADRGASLRSNRAGTNRALILGTGPHGRSAADAVLDSPELNTTLIGFLDFRPRGLWRYRDIPFIGDPERLDRIVATGQIDLLIIAVDAADLGRVQAVYDTAERMGVTVCLLPDIVKPARGRVESAKIGPMPVLLYRSVKRSRTSLAAKLLLDRLGGLVGLLFCLPVIVAAAAWIKLDSRGPVLFRQERCGRNGRRFIMYKFRTMARDAERHQKHLAKRNEIAGPVFKMTRDPRVTRPGRWLRKWSIDELPQFYNVLRGDMSLIGPRPPLPREVAEYQPWQHRRLSVKPGISCTWQVNGRNHIHFDRWMQMDLEYIDNWSLWGDVKLIAKTIPAVLKAEGAS